MGSANSTIPAAAVAVVGVLGYGYVHYLQHSCDGGTDADTNTNAGTVLHGQKKRGRKLQLPGDATLKNLDFLDSSPVSLPPATTPPVPARPRQQTAPRAQGGNGGVPGGFESGNVSDDARRSQQQERGIPSIPLQRQRQAAPSAPTKRKRGKKIAADLASTSTPVDAGAVPAPTAGKAEKTQVSVPAATADAPDERWTRVEARKKKAGVQPQDGLGKLQTGTDATTSDAGITTSVTGNSSPLTERTTEDELPSGLDECVFASVL
jgi:hypothetical protein